MKFTRKPKRRRASRNKIQKVTAFLQIPFKPMGLQVLELMQYTSVTTAPGYTGVVILLERCDMILFLPELY